MLTWITLAGAHAGIEHGIVRAHEVQALLSLDDSRERLAALGEQALAQARAEAEALLADGRQRAAQMIADAQAQIEAARQQGYEDGQREAVQRWQSARIDAAQDKLKALRATHERLAEIVTTAVERIVHTEDRAALYQRALKNVQALTRGASALVLRVSPADHEQARAGLGGLAGQGEAGLAVELKVDPGLKPGSCIFESDLGVLDASLQVQLEGLRGAMERAVRRALAESDDMDHG
jgi:type III secretion protein L